MAERGRRSTVNAEPCPADEIAMPKYEAGGAPRSACLFVPTRLHPQSIGDTGIRIDAWPLCIVATQFVG